MSLSRVVPCCFAVLVLVGCGATPRPGSESVRLVASDAAVAGMKLVDSASGSCGVAYARDIPIVARNFGVRCRVDTVLVRQSTAGQTVNYTMEAWR